MIIIEIWHSTDFTIANHLTEEAGLLFTARAARHHGTPERSVHKIRHTPPCPILVVARIHGRLGAKHLAVYIHGGVSARDHHGGHG